MTRFEAAMSRRFTARRKASGFSGVPIVSVAFFKRVRTSLFVARLREVALALVRIRFFWLLIFATSTTHSFVRHPEDFRTAQANSD